MLYDKNHALLESNIPGLATPTRGKVRDLYDLGEHLLIVTTDRISAYDVVLPNGIPARGKLLTQLTLFWLHFFKDTVATHFITADSAHYPQAAQAVSDTLQGRSMLVKKVSMIPFECIMRGYLSGNGWLEYQEHSTVNGQILRPGYQNGSKIDSVLFSPRRKRQYGDPNIPVTFAELEQALGTQIACRLATTSTAIYNQAAKYALQQGIIIADSKFEFGTDQEGQILLADEVLTPDSSRLWPQDDWQTGDNPPSLDKQVVRNWLDEVGFERHPPAPPLPDGVIAATRAKYIEAYERLTQQKFVG